MSENRSESITSYEGFVMLHTFENMNDFTYDVEASTSFLLDCLRGITVTALHRCHKCGNLGCAGYRNSIGFKTQLSTVTDLVLFLGFFL